MTHDTKIHDTTTHGTKTDQVAGTMDEDYDLFGYIETCLRTARLMETYRRNAEQAEDTALAALFTMTQNDSRKGAEIGRKLLAGRLTGSGTGTGTGTGTDADADTAGRDMGPDEVNSPAADQEAVRDHPVDVMAPTAAPTRFDEH